ncbi:MAG: exodeoxyribonuclease VII small subunit [Candidatus Omnitrophica bacterium]|nr:exodeoxyribonuclease VII small subunit [Candidatus Omnitrophota bacterium]
MTKQFDFEQAFEKLEDIVQELEAGSLGLEEAIKKFKVGSRLAQECLQQLQSVKIKVEQVVGEEKGKLKVRPFLR